MIDCNLRDSLRVLTERHKAISAKEKNETAKVERLLFDEGIFESMKLREQYIKDMREAALLGKTSYTYTVADTHYMKQGGIAAGLIAYFRSEGLKVTVSKRGNDRDYMVEWWY